MTDGQSASLSWNKAPIWGLQPDFYYCQTVAGLFMWGALSDKRTGLLFTIAADPDQCSHSQVWVPWDLQPYFTVSVSRPPFSSCPTTCRATVEVLNPAKSKSNLYYDRRSASQSVLEQSTHLGLMTRSWLLSDSCRFVGLGRPLRQEDRSVVCNCYWPSPAQSFSGPSPVGLVTIFYCLRFETSLFVTSYDSQGHGRGIRPS
jgi:hypothetical protein